MRSLPVRITCLLAVCLSFAAASAAFGQAYVAAHRGAEIAPFATLSYVQPNWGPGSNFGYTAGVDYTRFLPVVPLLVQPSFELRMTNGTGAQTTERSFSGGIKLTTTIHRVHPYGNFLEGFGYIYFVHPQMTQTGPYSKDESHIYAFGGGAEYDVSPNWKMLIDYSRQHWDLKPPVMTPTTTSIGVTYRIPFHDAKVQIH
jgi:hypothetical protein